MAESTRDQIIDAILALFRTIVADRGANFWYTPGLVKDVEGFSAACLDDSFADLADEGKATLYLLAPDEEETAEETTGTIEALMRLDLLLARQVDAVDHPLKDPDSPSVRKVQNRLARDAKKLIHTNSDLGGLAINFEVLRTEYASEEVGAGGAWACVLLRLQVHYEYWKANP